MSDMVPPLPTTGSFIKSVRESCRTQRIRSNIVARYAISPLLQPCLTAYYQLHPESIDKFLHSQSLRTTLSKLSESHGLSMPLNFPNEAAELNLISVLSLLNFTSAYRVPLHKATGRGAWDTIRYFVLSLYLSDSKLLSARGLLNITIQQVSEHSQLPIHVEKPHSTIPGLTIGETGGPLYELVQLITQVLNETGDILVKGGYPDMGSFVLEALKEAKMVGDRLGSPPLAETVLERLVKAFPTFQDMYIVNDEPVYIFKKALFMIHAIVLRFGSSSSMPIPDTSNLPIFSDNVIPSMLVHLGVLDLSACSELSSLFPASASLDSLLDVAPPKEAEGSKRDTKTHPPVEGPILTHSQAYILRAAAVDACELIIEAARNLPESPEDSEIERIRKMTLPELDGWLWSVAKERADYRDLVRFVERPTVFF
ncbi:hypothetical protein FRC02_003129 [Tulasnella sp. 418]|nr:hypothetical protein FRC02_003129 [Tulasnella sp. 418]